MILILVVGISSVSAWAVPPVDYHGIVSIDSVQAHPGESFGVKIWLTNNEISISAITVPLKFNSPDLTLDSVSLNGSIWTQDFSGFYMIDNLSQEVRITVLPSETASQLPSVNFTDGQIAEMFFTVDDNSSPHKVDIDSVYTDSLLPGNVHLFTRIDISDNTGTLIYLPEFVRGQVDIQVTTATGDDTKDLGLPTEFSLAQNYPNPFNPSTNIQFALPAAGKVKLQIFNILGQDVATLINGRMEAGYHQVAFDASSHPSGIYFYRITTENGSATRKMVFLK